MHGTFWRIASGALLVGASLFALVPRVAAQENERPIGWTVAFDDAAAADTSLFFVAMTPGWHITTGPAAILYDPARSAEGDFRIQAEVFLFPGASDAGFGLLFGGHDLDSASGRSYFEFLVRRDGSYMIAHRAGSDLHVLSEWAPHDSILPAEAADDPVLNTLGVDAGVDAIIFTINGDEVARFPCEPAMEPDGITGFRIGDDLNLHVRSLTVASSP